MSETFHSDSTTVAAYSHCKMRYKPWRCYYHQLCQSFCRSSCYFRLNSKSCALPLANAFCLNKKYLNRKKKNAGEKKTGKKNPHQTNKKSTTLRLKWTVKKNPGWLLVDVIGINISFGSKITVISIQIIAHHFRRVKVKYYYYYY